jgi:nucleoid DNA-binding protein
MNHKELTKIISSKFHLRLSLSEKLLNQIYTEITQELLRKKRVYLRKLGAFHSLHRPVRRSYDDVIFRPAKQLLKKFMHLNQKREEHFKILDRIKAKLPNIPAKEIEKDVHKASQTIRKKSVKQKPRNNWNQAFIKMHKNKDDRLL